MDKQKAIEEFLTLKLASQRFVLEHMAYADCSLLHAMNYYKELIKN